MTHRADQCFDADHLSRLLDERLSAVDESSVITHLNNCPDCQRRLEGVAADGSLWGDLRSHFTSRTVGLQTEQSPSMRQDQIARRVMEYLGPTDDPHMMGRLGSYEVCGIVGQGSTGLVLKAYERPLSRYVAIKVLAPNFASSGSARARFEREARAVAAVAHEHVVPVYAVDEYQGLPYLVMQYVGGGSLQQRISRSGPLTVTEIVRVGMQVASGLAAAHAQGIVHRDVKPANVLLESAVDRAMVTDFGLARVVDEASVTRSGVITGTPQFMSPEQAKGELIDHRSDLFSLGSLLYTASTGHPPFRSETVYGVIRRVCESSLRPMREVNAEIPIWLESFVGKLCSKNREDRFETAEQAREALSNELAHLQSPASVCTPVRWWEPAPEPARRSWSHRLGLIGAVAVLAAIVGYGMYANLPSTGTGSTQGDSPPQPRAEQDLASQVATTWNEDRLPVFASTISRAIPVEPNGLLELRAGRGNVEIASHDGQQLEIRVTRTVAAPDRQAADRLLAMHHLRLDSSDHQVAAHSNMEGLSKQEMWQFDTMEFKVFVPRRTNVEIWTIGGNVSATTVGGNLAVRTGGGILVAEEVQGDLTAETDGGAVSVQAIKGDADVASFGGHIHLGNVLGSVKTSSGAGETVLAQFIGECRAASTSGGLQATLVGQQRSPCEFTTISGEVTLILSDDFACDLAASTVAGVIRSPLLRDAKPLRSISTRINGGGQQITAETVKGDIVIRSPNSAAPRNWSSESSTQEVTEGNW